MNPSVFLNLSLAVLFLSLSACNAYKTQKRVNSLDTAITSYDVALRWAEYETAYSYHVSPNGTQPPANLDSLQELSVTGIEVKEKTIIGEESMEAVVKTEVSYFLKTEGTIRKLKLNQAWWYNDENNHWYIDGEFPKFE